MANLRPIFSLYSNDPRVQITLRAAQRVGHSTTIERALVAAARRIVDGDFRRCDIYDESALLRWSVIYYPGIGFAMTSAKIRVSMYAMPHRFMVNLMTAPRGRGH